MRLSLLIPFYNEEEQIPLTLETVIPIMESVTLDFEIIMIDDGSTDRTWDVLTQAARKDHRLRILRFARNFGKEAAICALMEAVSGDAAILMDGDLQHPPEFIPEMVRHWEDGYDIVEGVKSDRGKESFLSRFAANSFYKLFSESGGINLRDASDFKLMDRRVVDVWNTLEEHNTFFRGLCAWLGFKRKQFPFEVQERVRGTTKWNVRGLIRLSAYAITSFSTLPLKLILAMGFVFMIIALVLAIQTLVNFIIGHALGGFTTVILLILLTGGLIMISLGLIGTYIARIYDEVKGRPRFILAEDNKNRLGTRRNRRGRTPRRNGEDYIQAAKMARYSGEQPDLEPPMDGQVSLSDNRTDTNSEMRAEEVLALLEEETAD